MITGSSGVSKDFIQRNFCKTFLVSIQILLHFREPTVLAQSVHAQRRGVQKREPFRKNFQDAHLFKTTFVLRIVTGNESKRDFS